MRPEIIIMLTHHDVTVENAAEVFEACKDLPVKFWGFKNVGLPKDKMKELATAMKEAGKTTFLEVVTYDEQSCLDGAQTAIDCGFDYLMGTIYYDSVAKLLADNNMSYLPFVGKVSGSPSILEGTNEEIIANAKDLMAKGMNDNTIKVDEDKVMKVKENMLKNADEEAKDKASEVTALSRRLQSGYLIIEMAKAGTLGDIVLDLVENFSDVKGITVIGPMNARDIAQVASMANLEELDLKDARLDRIENEQFRNHDLLKTVRLPKTLTYLGGYAFYDCNGLVSVTISGNIQYGSYYDDNGNYHSSTMGSYIFGNCDALEEVIVEEGVKSIGYEMFPNCYRLSKLTLPVSLTSISDYAFYNCYSLASIPLPGNLTSIGGYAFYRDNKVGLVYNYQGYYYDDNGNYHEIYDTIPNLCPEQIVIPANVKNIGSYAFYNMGGLKNVTLNEGLTSIGYYAFYNTAIRTATFPSTLTSISYNVFNSGTPYTCLALEPPTVSSGCPVQNPDTLYVPMLVTKAYKQAAGWANFKIVGADIMPDNLIVHKQMNLDFAKANIPEGYKPNLKILWTNINQSSTGTPSQLGALEVHNGGTFSVGYLEMNYSTAQSNYYRYYYRSNYGQSSYTPQYSTIITDGSMRADNITIRVHITDGYWSFISLPYDVRVGDITCETAGTDWVIRRYDGAARAAVDFNNTWVNMGEDDILEAGKGYIMHCAFTSDWYDYRVFRFPAPASSPAHRRRRRRSAGTSPAPPSARRRCSGCRPRARSR